MATTTGCRRARIPAACLIAAGISLWAQPAGEDLEQRAGELVAAGRYKEAVTLYQSLAARQPGSAPVFINLGVAYAKLEQFVLAAKAYRGALEIDPASLPALINLGLAEFKAGKFRDAVKPLEIALRHDPENCQAQTLLGMSYFSLREFAAAANLFEKLFRADPKNTMLQYLLGECYFRSHQQERLEAYVQELVKAAPDSAALHMLAGEAYDRLNQTDEAIREFQAAKRAVPFLPRIHFYLGYLHWEKKEYAEAEEEFEAERTNPSGERAQAEGYLGDIALRNGDSQRAELLFNSALARDRNVHIARFGLGVLYAEQNRLAEAAREFEAAIALAPNRADAYYRLARIYRTQGKLERQKAMLSKVRQINESKRLSVESVLRDSSADLR